MFLANYRIYFVYTNALFLFVSSLVDAQTKYVQGASRLKLAVYYESLCPHSRTFISEVLTKVYSTDKMNLRFIPFGNSEIKPDGTYFKCQHGEIECFYNIMQACVLETLHTDDNRLAYTACAITKPTIKGQKHCLGLAGQTLKNTMNCVFGRDGKRTMLIHGNDTQYALNGIQQVPTIIFNEKYQWKDQQAVASVEALRQIVFKYKSEKILFSR